MAAKIRTRGGNALRSKNRYGKKINMHLNEVRSSETENVKHSSGNEYFRMPVIFSVAEE